MLHLTLTAMDTTWADDHPHLRRRNSISTAFSMVAPYRYFSSPSDDLELLSIKADTYSYSSLKDLLQSTTALNFHKTDSALSGPEIFIRNRLVKQAARAYLRPMPAVPGSINDKIFHRLWRRAAGVIDICCRNVTRALDETFRVVGIRSSGLQGPRMCLI